MEGASRCYSVQGLLLLFLLFLLHLPPKVKEVMFSPVCLFVCLFVCVQDISQSCEWIQAKLGGHVGSVTPKNRFNFGEDPNPDLDLIIF